jgi:hypothetical protein
MDHPEEETKPESPPFDFDSFPVDALFHERREGRARRRSGPVDSSRTEEAPRRPPLERRARKERRRRIDPTTFEKQYSEDEMEFMNAMQQFKVQSGTTFPSHGEVLRVAFSLGYSKWIEDDEDGTFTDSDHEALSSATQGPFFSE